MKNRLYRSRQDKLIAGVCGGIAEHFKIDPVWVRLIAVILVFIDGLGILLYAVLWLIMPKNPNQSNVRNKMTSKTVAGKVSLAVEKELQEEFNKPKSRKKKERKKKNANQSASKVHKDPISKNKNSKKRSTSTSILIAVAVILFNLIFVIGIFIGLLGVLVGLFAAGIGCIIAGILTFVASFATLSGTPYFNLGVSPIAGIFISIGITTFGILFTIADWYIAKGFFYVSAKYFKFNYRLITGRRN
ncbi:PspC domain-containing protein [Candidatus Woesearchaeota archaeon]|nr:PspC domain-containing protein [Candidatus Woesearchaeota archaeon]